MARQGIAVLRCDDRVVGELTGDRSGATSADFATDVEAGIEFLKKHPKIDAGKIGLIGHSEGGLIAPMVAAARDDVHFIVLLAGTGVNGGVILKSQSTAMMQARGESEESLDANRKVHDAILGPMSSTTVMMEGAG
jgi:dienelactone hydrolase